MTTYTQEALTHIPPEMQPWGLQLVTPEPSEFGQYVLIGVEQASIEGHHQVEIVDEDGKPMRGVWVIFGWGSGPNINMPARINHWRDSPAVLKGNAQRTNAMGYVQHTFGEGGEDIWIWDRNKDGDILYPSAIVRNCTWQRTPVARFEHTGVLVQFALRRVNVTPAADRLATLEVWATTLETQLRAESEQRQAIEARLGALESKRANPPGGHEA